MFSKLISIKFDKKYVSIVILLFTLIFSGCIDDRGSLEEVYNEELTPVKPGINSEFNTDSLHVEHKSEKKKDFMGQYTDRIHVFGKVENNANNSISLLRVAAGFYDENQNLICTVWLFVVSYGQFEI